MKGGCLVVFPAGGVSTTPTIWHRRAMDAEWKNLTARLIAQAKAPVAPVYFAGQNSRLFQIARHISSTLRLSLIFKEVHDRIGSDVHIRIGDILPYERIAGINDRQSVMDKLKEITYSLGDGVPVKPERRGGKRPRRDPRSKVYP
jgi:putative hemolysin